MREGEEAPAGSCIQIEINSALIQSGNEESDLAVCGCSGRRGVTLEAVIREVPGLALALA